MGLDDLDQSGMGLDGLDQSGMGLGLDQDGIGLGHDQRTQDDAGLDQYGDITV